MPRNIKIENSVKFFINLLDSSINESALPLPNTDIRKVCDEVLSHRSGSVRLASVFLTTYSLFDDTWNYSTVPTGIRGTFGDKLFAEQLNRRFVTFHKSITAFGENLGWKGNVSNVNLRNDPRFNNFLSFLNNLDKETREKIVNYFAYRVSESIYKSKPLPPVSSDVLTFTKSKLLFNNLVSLPTEGHVPQFLIASLLKIHRDRYGYEIRTHHPHASDTFDDTAGDIEELHNGLIVSAYEVTTRPDWKNRLSDFTAKMDKFGLNKYIIIASDVNIDSDLSSPQKLLSFVEPTGRDLAILDIHDVISVFSAELSSIEIRRCVNYCYDLLLNPTYCGRHDIIELYRNAVDAWIDEAGS